MNGLREETRQETIPETSLEREGDWIDGDDDAEDYSDSERETTRDFDTDDDED